MNLLDYYDGLCAEFGFKIKFKRYNVKEIEACVLMLRLQNNFNIYNLVSMLAKYGIIEVLDIEDEAIEAFC